MNNMNKINKTNCKIDYETPFKTRYICQTGGKIGAIKDKIISKLELDFRGLITIIITRPSYGHSRRDYVSRTNNYILDNTNWKKISSEYMMQLSSGIEYEHLELYEGDKS